MTNFTKRFGRADPAESLVHQVLIILVQYRVLPTRADDLRRGTDSRRMGGDIIKDDRIRADSGVGPDRDITQHDCARA